MQDIASRQWSKRGTVLSLRCAQDGTVVSYLLDINGFEIACHRIFLRKLHLPDDNAVVERATVKAVHPTAIWGVGWLTLV